MINAFDTEVAKDVGVNASIIYKNIQFWCEKNRTNEQNFHGGLYWTYNSIKAFCEQFPYLSEKQIRNSLNILEEKGYIKSGNFNKSTYDRTKWYADIRADSICPFSQMDNAEKANENVQKGEPIPDINTDINTNESDIYMCPKQKNSRFIPPSIEEVRAYCEERHNDVDAEKFVAFYSSKNWMIGKNKMANWKQAVITWERGRNNKPKQNQYENPFTALLKEEGYV